MAFNAKNLTYESNEPKFLRKLKSQYGGVDSARHERPLSRPRKQKDGDDDDEPTYVDENSRDIISKAQYNAMLSGENHTLVKDAECPSDSQEKPSEEPGEPKQPPAKPQQMAAIGAHGKRKIAKVFGNNEEDVQVKPDNKESPNGKKPMKKVKKIKLSFDDQAGAE